MKNFIFCNPTKLIFGQGSINKISKQIPQGSKILLTYGGGSIIKNGIYDQVIAPVSYTHLYVNAHLKRARFFVKYYNVGALLFKPSHFTMPNYPLYPPVLRMGVAVDLRN